MRDPPSTRDRVSSEQPAREIHDEETPRPPARSRRADISWKIREYLFDLLAAQRRGLGAAGQYRQPGDWVSENGHLIGAGSARCQYNPPAMHVRVERVARPQPKFATNRIRQDYLSFGGNSSLHCKIILPQADISRQLSPRLDAGAHECRLCRWQRLAAERHSVGRHGFCGWILQRAVLGEQRPRRNQNVSTAGEPVAVGSPKGGPRHFPR